LGGALSGQVPSNWGKVAYPSLKPLGSWIKVPPPLYLSRPLSPSLALSPSPFLSLSRLDKGSFIKVPLSLPPPPPLSLARSLASSLSLSLLVKGYWIKAPRRPCPSRPCIALVRVGHGSRRRAALSLSLRPPERRPAVMLTQPLSIQPSCSFSPCPFSRAPPRVGLLSHGQIPGSVCTRSHTLKRERALDTRVRLHTVSSIDPSTKDHPSILHTTRPSHHPPIRLLQHTGPI
jgi:hypothetical protein